ncbi:MAG: Ger(x)C family spore germination protein [Firmicutes bacterium]|mgnify:FL=1|nr:Ger(x)C family spore germination protein [Bacillota bacterium]
MGRGGFGDKYWRYFLLLLIGLFVTISTGCWDRREPELLVFVLSVGFDKEPSGDYKIVAQMFNPLALSQEGSGGGSPGGDKKPSWVVEASGQTPFEARKNLAPMVSRELFWSYTSTVLISEKLAREGIRPIMDLLERERQFRLIARPLVAEGDIKEILASEYPLEGCSGQALLRQLNTGDKMRSIAPVLEMRELINVAAQPGRDLLIAKVKAREVKEDAAGDKEEGVDKIVATQPPIYLGGGAAFCGDRMAGWISDREARGWHWVQGRVRRETLTLVIRPDGEPVSVEIFRVQSQIKPVVKDDQVTMKIKVEVKGRVQDQVSEADLASERKFLLSLEARLATLIKNDIKAALKRAQELDSDFLGFGNAVYRMEPKKWKLLESKWSQVLAQLELDLDVRADVTVAGLIKEPVKMK